MAWRIHDSVVRGELDNRVRGRVTGRLWFHGREEPVQLDLSGNACPDLAGCELRFENPLPTTPLRSEPPIDPVQRGPVGDVTASRKVRVFDVPIHEACDRLRRGETPPEHIANCLYLEWFSERNGRVVVESADYVMTLSEPLWRLSPEEEQARRNATEQGWDDFLGTLTEAVRREQEKVPEGKDPGTWDEFDFEQVLRESDARTDKLMALYDRYEGHPDADDLIAREMGWSAGQGPDGIAAHASPEWFPSRIDAPETAKPNPRTEGIDWVWDETGTPVHPAYLRCHRAGRAAWDAVDLMSERIQNDPDVSDLIAEIHITTARLAGALNPLAFGRNHCEPPFIVACLKRSLSHLHGAQAALKRVRTRNLLPPAPLTAAATELAGIREDILALMQEFRRNTT